MTTDSAQDPMCDICCRPLSRHIASDRQCPETSYFREMPATPDAATWLGGGYFTTLTTKELAAQCRMQATDNLDPEYCQFMMAVANRLAAAPEAPAAPAPGEHWATEQVKRSIVHAMVSYAASKTDMAQSARKAADDIIALLTTKGSAIDFGVEAPTASVGEEEWRKVMATMLALFAGPVISFDVREPYYLGSCDACGWVGSTEQCPHSEEDAICPRCMSSGVDCGKVAAYVATPPADLLERAREAHNVLLGGLEEARISPRGWRISIMKQAMTDAANLLDEALKASTA